MTPKPDSELRFALRFRDRPFEADLIRHYNGVQPRVGLAWSPNSKTVMRAGFGLFDDRYNLSFLFITQPQRPVIIPGEALPGIRQGADTATWVLNQLTPGAFGLPADAAKTLVLTGQVLRTNSSLVRARLLAPPAPVWFNTTARSLTPSKPTSK